MNSAGNIFRNAFGLANLRRPLRERRKHGLEIDFLKRLTVLHVPRDLAHEQDHWRRVLLGNVHANSCIGCARAARHKG